MFTHGAWFWHGLDSHGFVTVKVKIQKAPFKTQNYTLEVCHLEYNARATELLALNIFRGVIILTHLTIGSRVVDWTGAFIDVALVS